jgi:hypothetical protein
MPNEWGNISRKRLMETITLLWTLKDIPGTPKENNLPVDGPSMRQLTIERERSIVEILAFLSATTDDPLKVMAVCVEESSGHDCLTIRLATNTGDCSDVEAGFRNMAKVLERSTKRGD